MKLKIITRGVLVILLCFLPQLSLADDSVAIKTIAGIVLTLNHYPSADDKAVLMAITKDDSVSASVKSIAQAVHDLQHKVSAADKSILEGIPASDSAKALANVLVGINHTPGADAKAALKTML